MIRILSGEDARQLRPQLADLLVDCVDSGASVGFLPPLSIEEAESYWNEVIDSLHPDRRILAVVEADGRIAGSVQLALENRPNGNHRAEILKLMVHRSVRGRGLAKELMRHAESVARECRRSLLVLDTKEGDTAEQLYYKLGYVKAGVIPQYARDANGELQATVLMFKQI